MNTFNILAYVANMLNTVFNHSFWYLSTSISVFLIIVLIVLTLTLAFTRKPYQEKPIGPNVINNPPMVSMITCVKGYHAESLRNFKRNLMMEYPGKMEFIFVVESEEDPAIPIIQQSISETIFTDNEKRSAKIAVAGISFHSAQKLQNILCGVMSTSPESTFILNSDDDVYFYPGLVEELIEPLIDDPDHILLSTGYEFVAPQPGSTIASYSFLTFRLHNLFSFITDRPLLCWGGCMASPRKIWIENKMNLIDSYLDGGYSDDQVISCLIKEGGYVAAHPFRATFPTTPDKSFTTSKYWEYIRRQLFVLCTYSTPYNWATNVTLGIVIILTCYLMAIWMALMPFVTLAALIALPSGALELSVPIILSFITTAGWFFFWLSVKYATKVLIGVSNSTRPVNHQVVAEVSLLKFFFGALEHIILMPLALIVDYFSDSIVWSGIRYYKRRGRIAKVERVDENGRPYTGDFTKSVADFVATQEFKSTFPVIFKRIEGNSEII